MSDKEKEPTEEIKKALASICTHFDKEDRMVRERQVRLWKKMEYYWSGFQRLWWSEVAHDWRVFDVNATQDSTITGDASFYDKPINVFRAYLESIIAAMSQTVPPVKCFPDDADNPSDILTAKGGTKIAELIYKHVDAPLLWCHALYVYCTQGLCAAYNYPKEDLKYGSVEVPTYEDVEEEQEQRICPNCGAQITPTDIQMMNDEIDEFQPGDDDVVLHGMINEADGKTICAQCQMEVDPEIQQNKVVVTRMTGVTQKAKTRQCIEVYGGLYVKVPNYAKKQEDIPYLFFNYETHFSNVVARYPHLRDKHDNIIQKIGSGSGGAYDPYERWGRLSTQYFGEYPINTPTVRNCWLRNSAFEVCPDEDVREKLKKKYPDGVKVVFINDEFAEAENESLDDCWTLTKNPLSEYIHFDPLGMLVTSVQEITNDIISLVLQTIEHGIPQTFADPQVLNFEQYRQVEAIPGMIFPARAKSGKTLQEAFHEVKTATLSKEVQPFSDKIQELGQFVSGALPSLYGGNQDNSSKTAAQYSMSRAQSLQRLQTPYKMMTFWWKNIFAKVIPSYIKTMLEDEHWAEQKGKNDFVNVVVKKAQMDGKIGSVELEASDQLPITWAQSKDVIMNLLQSANPEVLQALASPENMPLLADAIGLSNFNVPGEDDREKQYEEIGLLIQSQPTPSFNQQTGQPEEVSSIQPEFFVDNHGIEGDVCRRWLVSEAGRQCKIDNPNGYKNVLLHLKLHMQMLQQLRGMNGPPPPQQGANQPAMKQQPQGQQNVTH